MEINSLTIKQYEDTVLEAINSIPYPLEMKRLILSNIMNVLESQLNVELTTLSQSNDKGDEE